MVMDRDGGIEMSLGSVDSGFCGAAGVAAQLYSTPFWEQSPGLTYSFRYLRVSGSRFQLKRSAFIIPIWV